jgi:hypothetical protein
MTRGGLGGRMVVFVVHPLYIYLEQLDKVPPTAVYGLALAHQGEGTNRGGKLFVLIGETLRFAQCV